MSGNSVLNKDNATNIAKIKVTAIEWYGPQYTPSITQKAFFIQTDFQILSKTPTKLQYEERSVLMKEVDTQKVWTFELRTQ